MPQVICLKRSNANIPYGFKMQGGADFSIPLSVLQVTACSVADQAGLKAGDALLKINDQETFWMDHQKAKAELQSQGNEINLTIERNAVDPVKPTYTPLSQLRVNPQQNLKNLPVAPIPKKDLTVDKGESIIIGSSHNRAPMPFNREIGNTIVYQAAKPTNWIPGDYTEWAPPSPGYNPPPSPGLNNHSHHVNGYNQFGSKPDLSTTSSFVIPAGPLNRSNSIQKMPSQLKSSISNPRGVDSLSMRMLNANLNEVQGSNRQPASVFDLKHGHPVAGSPTVPKGFRSVTAPIALPPEQKRAPMRKEFQVQHIKKTWIDPKF